MSRRWVYSVEKKYRKLKQEQILVSLASHIDCSFLTSSAFKALRSGPYISVFRAETKSSTGSQKYIKKSEKQETPLFSVSSMKRNISPPLSGPAGKLICQTDPFAKTVVPGLLANCTVQARKALPGFPGTAHAPRGPGRQRICTWCHDRDLAKRLRFPCAVCYYLHRTQKHGKYLLDTETSRAAATTKYSSLKQWREIAYFIAL